MDDNGVPKLLDLIPNEKKWLVQRDCGFGVEEEKTLELRLGPPLQLQDDDNYYHSSKRGFSETNNITNQGRPCCPSLPHAGTSSNNNSKSATSARVVGWPPVRSFRKNIASSSTKPPAAPVEVNKGLETKKGLFVKINMDGIPIGRKVDLMAYDSYQKLSSAVQELFQGLLAAQKDPLAAGVKMSEEENKAFTHLLDGSGEYTLIYQDTEGDKMLVGDVPWDMFVSTAKRLRVLKSSELYTLSLGAISRKRTALQN